MDQDNPSNIDATIADLEGWLQRISTTIETLKFLRSQGGSVPVQPIGVARTSPNGNISHDTFFQMTVPDAAEKDLKLAKKTKATAEIASSLLRGGLKSASKDFPAMVKTVLARDSRFVKVNKEWGLSEWYPSMRRGNRTVSTSEALDSKGPEPAATKTPKDDTHGGSVKNRTLALLDSNPTGLFTAKKIAETLGFHRPSVCAALSTLLGAGLIARPKTGEYKSLKVA